MSTSKKTEAAHRWGGPGASEEDATEPRPTEKGQPKLETKNRRSAVSGGGGERDSHHTHDPEMKGDT